MKSKETGSDMNWTCKVERFINNLNKSETEFLIDFFKGEIASTMNEYKKLTKKSADCSTASTLYSKFICKNQDGVNVAFSCTNCKLPTATLTYSSNIIPVAFGLSISNARNATFIDFSGSLSEKKLSEDEWTRVFNIMSTLLKDHKRLLKYPEYRKELESSESDESSISVDEEKLADVVNSIEEVKEETVAEDAAESTEE